jgi:hypothetical protein
LRLSGPQMEELVTLVSDSLWHKYKAEREYLRLLPAQANALLEMRNCVMRHGVVTSEELEELITSLDRASEGLSVKHRRLISAALHQRQLRGRARYAAKLMNKAGIGSGPFPIATP